MQITLRGEDPGSPGSLKLIHSVLVPLKKQNKTHTVRYCQEDSQIVELSQVLLFYINSQFFF